MELVIATMLVRVASFIIWEAVFFRWDILVTETFRSFVLQLY